MFRISEFDLALIQRAAGQSPFNLPVLEKDLVISRILESVKKTPAVGFSIAFGGGTSLVKARGLMDRLSEDVDLKAIIPEATTRSAQRVLLRNYFKQLQDQLVADGFSDLSTPVTRYEGRLRKITIPYATWFPGDQQVIPSVELEIFGQKPLEPVLDLPIRSIAAVSAGEEEQQSFRFPIVSLSETIPQKVIAMLSRIERIDANPKQIRHLYDIWRLREISPSVQTMQRTFDFSVAELPQRTRAFSELSTAQVVDALTGRMASLKSNGIEKAFRRQLDAIATDPPSISEAIFEFEQVAIPLLINAKRLD